MSGNRRLVIVAKHLPYEAKRVGTGRATSWELTENWGGLPSALTGIEQDVLYIGRAGLYISDIEGQQSLIEALAEKSCVPVFLDQNLENDNNEYCNNYIRPLFHCENIESPSSESLVESYKVVSEQYKRQESLVKSYEVVNEMFAKVVIEQYKREDLVWCQDYHLMLLPELLKKQREDMIVGWYLHTRFAPYEFICQLPSYRKLLRGVTAADLIGLHMKNDTDKFMSSCLKELRYKKVIGGLRDGDGKLIHVDTMPMGIDPQKFIGEIQTPEVQREISELDKEMSSPRTYIVTIDNRLDPRDKHLRKYLGFELFLEKFREDYPTEDSNTSLVPLLMASRTDVPKYQELKGKVDSKIGHITRYYPDFSIYMPSFMKRAPDFQYVCALFYWSDILMIMSTQEGMHMAPFEYVACQEARPNGQKKGVLILCEFSDETKVLKGALHVNPLDVDAVAGAISRAIHMSYEERASRHEKNYESVKAQTGEKWRTEFMEKAMAISSSLS